MLSGLQITDYSPVSCVTLSELLCLSVPQFSYLLSGLLNALLPKTIRNTQCLNRVDLVACSNLGNSTSQGAMRRFRKRVLGRAVAGFELVLGDFRENSKTCGFGLSGNKSKSVIP